MARLKNREWNLSDPVKTWDELHAALLMDIRDELQELNRTLGHRFQSHFHKGMDAMERTDKRLAKKIRLRVKS